MTNNPPPIEAAGGGDRPAPVHPGTDKSRGTLPALALGTFAIGTEAFMIAAILPQIAEELSVSVAAAGQLVTIFTLVYAFSSPLLTALTAGYSRRGILIGALGAFMLANLVAAVAPNYWALIGARVLLALAAGLYVPNANALAGALVPLARRGRALAIVNGGNTVAVALGVPAGAFAGANFGWRTTFLGVAAMSAIALLVLAVRLPRHLAGSPVASIRQRLELVGHAGTLPVLLTTTLWAMGAFTVYTYAAPFLSVSTGATPEHAGMMITLVGVSAIVGVALGGIANDRFGARRVQAVALPVMAVAFAGLTGVALALSPHALVALVPMFILWGMSAWGFSPSQQHRVIGVVGAHHAAVGLSLNASFMQLGFALGAAFGSLVISLTSVLWIGAAGAGCVLLSALISHRAWERSGDN